MAIPRRPNPRDKGGDTDPKFIIDTVVETMQDGTDLGRPERNNQGGRQREFRLTERLFETFRYTEEWLGWTYEQSDRYGRRLHSDVCRQRICEVMKHGSVGIDRMKRMETRM